MRRNEKSPAVESVYDDLSSSKLIEDHNNRMICASLCFLLLNKMSLTAVELGAKLLNSCSTNATRRN